jgi:hypothetical protein
MAGSIAASSPAAGSRIPRGVTPADAPALSATKADAVTPRTRSTRFKAISLLKGKRLVENLFFYRFMRLRYNPFMLRLTEIKLPLDHPPEAIAAEAVAQRLLPGS